MCKKLFSAPKAPKLPPAVDPAIERQRAENEATAKANAETASRRRSRRASSLLASGASGVEGDAMTGSVLAKAKLGE